MTAKPAKWIVVRNWTAFQHYKDAWPVWIKFHTGLLHDPNFTNLPVGTRLVLCQLWLVYASTRAQLPLDTRWLSRQLSMRVTSKQLESLNHAGFIEFKSRPCLEHVKSASSPNALARERPSVSPRGRRKTTTPQNKNGRGQADAAATEEENGHDDLTPDPEGLKRIARIMADAELKAATTAPPYEPTPQDIAEAERRQAQSMEWLKKNKPQT